MAIENSLDTILNTASKVKITRLFTSRTDDFKASGREIAKLIQVSPPATHAALKELHEQGILKLEIIGKQHIYTLNAKSRIVKDILRPSFKKELSLKEDIGDFLIKKLKNSHIKHKISSLILYGSLQRGRAQAESDVDIAVVVKDKKDTKEIRDKFVSEIAAQFNEYFGAHLDAYVKSRDEFAYRMKKRLSPVSTLLESYSVIFGKEPFELV
jgi:predicted nucleotidyltransferase